MNKLKLEDSVNAFAAENLAYYQQWLFDEPLYISTAHTARMQSLQQVMFTLVKYFVENYQDYSELMPVSDKANQVMALFRNKAYLPGTYRTDFVYDENQQVKLIEITCRFALNGMFLPAVMNLHSQSFVAKTHPNHSLSTPYTNIYAYLDELRKGAGHIVILKGSDTRNESKIYKGIYQETGITVSELHHDDIEANLVLLEGAWIVSELALDEILSLDLDVIKFLASQNVINDFRTVFLLHDKRFFSVLGDEDFQKAALTAEERRFFNAYYVPTYCAERHPDIVAEAKANKNAWILKHRALGKSQSIFAGIVTKQAEWDEILDTSNLDDYVLQAWVPQKTYAASVKGTPYNDYITGTLLFFDNNFFGFGDFRTSSFPITNVVDHRKASCVIMSEQDMESIQPKIAITS